MGPCSFRVDVLGDPSTTSATSLDCLQGRLPGPPSSAAVPLTVVPSASDWLSSPGLRQTRRTPPQLAQLARDFWQTLSTPLRLAASPRLASNWQDSGNSLANRSPPPTTPFDCVEPRPFIGLGEPPLELSPEAGAPPTLHLRPLTPRKPRWKPHV